MKDLPSVYANKIDREIKNNNELYRGSNELKKKKSVLDLQKYFDSNGYANKLNVVIRTKTGSKNEKLILLKDNYFININNQRIYFDEILDYEVK